MSDLHHSCQADIPQKAITGCMKRKDDSIQADVFNMSMVTVNV